jgi:hypothetical protein
LDEETLGRLFQAFQEWSVEINRLAEATEERAETLLKESRL